MYTLQQYVKLKYKNIKYKKILPAGYSSTSTCVVFSVYSVTLMLAKCPCLPYGLFLFDLFLTLWKSHFSFLHTFKLLMFAPRPLPFLPSRISNDLQWLVMDTSLELKLLTFNWSPQTFVHNSHNILSNQTIIKVLLLMQIAITFIFETVLLHCT